MTAEPVPKERWLRIIPIALLMYTISFINRTNISLALPAISRDLHLTGSAAGQLAGIFFWGYLLLQIPGGYLAQRWSAKWLIAVMLTAWGLCAVGCGLARNWQELALMRFLLGLAEGSVYPATLVLLSNWFPRNERARANGFWNLCLPMAVVFSSPLSGWLLDQWNWRVMLVASGLVPFVWLVLWVLFISDSPRKARWISPAERDYLERTLAAERQAAESARRGSTLATLLQPQVLVMVGIYFCFIFGSIGMVFWLPTVLAGQAHSSNLVVSTLYIVPFIVGAVAMVLNSLHSDKVRERRIHAAIPLLGGGLFLLGAVAANSAAPLAAYALLCLAGVGLFGPLGPFWAMPSERLPKEIAGPAIGLVNAVGSLGGYFGPLAVGYLQKQTGDFAIAFCVLAGALLLGGLLAFLLDPIPSKMESPAPMRA
ncbi:MAG TPA: MFS transporter [Rhizomicrobium sp.]|nr:MFS transporter [Rhizomicrobium sp.]